MKDLYPNHRPRGVRKSWEHTSMEQKTTGAMLVNRGVPADWGTPMDAVAWFDDDALRVLVADYENGRRVTFRQRSRDYSISFSSQDQPA